MHIPEMLHFATRGPPSRPRYKSLILPENPFGALFRMRCLEPVPEAFPKNIKRATLVLRMSLKKITQRLSGCFLRDLVMCQQPFVVFRCKRKACADRLIEVEYL